MTPSTGGLRAGRPEQPWEPSSSRVPGAQARYVRMTPMKVRRVVDLIRNKSVGRRRSGHP